MVSIVDPSIEPNVEVREILARHSASIVPLIPRAHHPGEEEDEQHHHHHSHLPHMPNRRTGQASEATQASFESSRTVKALGWLGRAVEWLVGAPAVKGLNDESAAHAPVDDEEFDEEKALGEKPVARYAPDRRARSGAVHRPSLDVESVSSSGSRSAAEAGRYKVLFEGVGARSAGRSREATPAPSEGSGSGDDQEATPRASCESEREEERGTPDRPGHGGLVYVRMSDGRLVRKLSTIASASEAATAVLASEVSGGRARDGSGGSSHGSG